MITENELQISNMSYTEKDYASIYPALLDLVKQLTNKWDPSISNESDPGNVLLKLLAAVGDKNNYNIDKNVLECFMPSATQETSMRMLTEAVGYNMRYYQSAMTEVTFKYTDTLSSPLTFGRFGTVVTNQDNSIAYTLIEDVILATKNVGVSALAIEGQLNDLIVGDNEVIKLENLDDNNRLYFPETYVAENGVFITNDGVVNFDEWTKVNNLNTQQPLTRCYKFSYDSQAELPYIEFPSDIAQLIDSGLRVSYIVTTADAGNVSAGVLNQVASTNVSYDNDNLVVFNVSASTNGKVKETIDEAYSNFKKIIGTFDTLVTTRDYANAMYNSVDQYSQPLVSNAQASDRVNDVNYGLKVMTYDTNGQYLTVIPSDDMTVSDLILYPLKPYKGENYNVFNPGYVYNESYKPLKSAGSPTGEGEPTPLLDDDVLVNELDELKCIAHTYKQIYDYSDDAYKENLIYNFKNIANLDVQLFTYAKVNVIAQTDIINNVKRALSDNFNARMVEYGYEIPYDKLLDVIYSADSRIKSVSLGEPEYSTNILYATADGEEEPLTADGGDVISSIVAKNVLGGKLSLFLYDTRFDWRFGQTNVETWDNIESITTSLAIPYSDNISGGAFEYTCDKNEVIQLIAPTLNTTYIYPAGVYYRFTSLSPNENVPITADADYQLSSTDTLNIYYVDSEEITRSFEIPSGTIIRPSFDMAYTDGGSATFNGSQYDKINTNQTLETREYVQIKLDNLSTPIYWIRNNDNNILFNSDETSVVLDAGEYFIYSNSNFDDLVVLGAGTYIERSGTDTSQWSISNTVSVETINLNGVDAFTSSDWQYKGLTSSNYLTLQEMQIITLNEEDTLIVSGWDNHPNALTDEWKELEASEITVRLSNNSVQTLSPIINANLGWKIRTRLDINAGPDEPQILLTIDQGTHGAKTQAVGLKLTDNTIITIPGTSGGETCLLFNYPISIAGGDNIDMLVTNVLTGSSSYDLSACKYVSATSYYGSDELDTASNINLSLVYDDIIELPISIEKFEIEQPSQEEIAVGVSSTYNYQPFATYIIPMLFTQGDENTTVTFNTLYTKEYFYNEYDYKGDKVEATSLRPGLNNIEIVANWDGEYNTLKDLVEARPCFIEKELTETDIINFSTDVGNRVYYTRTGSEPNYAYSAVSDTTYDSSKHYYVKPNVSDTYCIVKNSYSGNSFNDASTNYEYSADSYSSGLYQFLYQNDTNGYWSMINGTENTSYELLMNVLPALDPEAESFLTIGKIHKIADLNAAITVSMSGEAVLEKIRQLSTKQTYVDAGLESEPSTWEADLEKGLFYIENNGEYTVVPTGTPYDSSTTYYVESYVPVVNADGNDVTFHYTYEPNNADVIEVDDMASPEAFWDVNNIANRITIPQLDLDSSRIYVARVSQL